MRATIQGNLIMADLNLTAAPMHSNRGFKILLAAVLVLSLGAVGLSVVSLLFATGVLKGGKVSSDFASQAQAYIEANPDVIVGAFSQMEVRQKAAAENELTAVLIKRHDEIFEDATSPTAGNVAGNVTLVEFFDYNCPYCRKAAPIMHELVRADPQLRVVFKEFPILGPGSNFAARAALASQKQGKYLAFHNAMIGYDAAITESSARKLAESAGLDMDRLQKDMADPAIDEAIKRNLALAEALRITGTPSFVTGKEITRGLVDLNTMKRLVASARQP
jgi:protein-disulfide isomerase